MILLHLFGAFVFVLKNLFIPTSGSRMESSIMKKVYVLSLVTFCHGKGFFFFFLNKPGLLSTIQTFIIFWCLFLCFLTLVLMLKAP